MSHSLLLGMTACGKTSLAKQLAHRYKSAGIGVLVLDPLHDPGWGADFQSADPDDFLRVLWGSRRCAVFIDESGDSVGRYDQAMIRTATRGRHWGHSCHYLTQRGVQLSRTVRDQCTHLFLFTTALPDSKIHATEWNSPELTGAPQLEQLEFFHTTRYSGVKRMKVVHTKEKS